MELTYNEKLVMPSNFVAIDDNEMTYIDGGGYSSSVMSLAEAKGYLLTLCILFGVGTGLSGAGTTIFPGFAVTDVYFGYNTWRALDCYNDVCKWIDSYGSNRACKYGVNSLCGIVLGVDVELLDYNMPGGFGDGGHHR